MRHTSKAAFDILTNPVIARTVMVAAPRCAPARPAARYRSASSFRRPLLLPIRSAGTPSLCSIVR